MQNQTIIPTENKLKKTNPTDHRTKFDKVYSLAYFYEKYNKKYPLTMHGAKKGIMPKKITFELYKKIFFEYQDIYFKELYFKQNSSYFLYTGSLELVSYSPRVIKAGVTKILGCTIGFFWGIRPSVLFYDFVRIIRLTGSSNHIPKIELLYKNNLDDIRSTKWQSIW